MVTANNRLRRTPLPVVRKETDSFEFEFEGCSYAGYCYPGSANAVPDQQLRTCSYTTYTLVVAVLAIWSNHRVGKAHKDRNPDHRCAGMDDVHRLGYPLRVRDPSSGRVPSVAWHWRKTIQPGGGPEVPAQVVPRSSMAWC